MTGEPELRQRNLEAIRTRSDALYQRLVNYRPLAHLVFGDDGAPDIVLNGNPFYSGKIHDFVAEQIENFHRYSRQVLLSPMSPSSFDEEGARFLDDVLVHCVNEGVEFLHKPREENSYNLIIFGVGLGLHIKQLVERTECFALIIIEPNFEFLYHSLDACDWAAIFEIIDERSGQIRFLFNDISEVLSVAIRQNIRNINPCAVDGMRYFIHYNTPLFQDTISKLNKEYNLIIAGLGFFYDETLMITQAHNHLYSGKSRVYLRSESPRTTLPAFVVASGPSIDKDMPIIRELQDRAIVISCGSALRPLLKNGIKPDFQIEIENILVSPLISQVAAEYDLSDICLMTASTVDPEITKYFEKIIFYFRASLSPFPIFCDTERRCLAYPNPTVLNAGASFAQEAGVRDIYLFGADLSVKHPSLHHSKDAYQYTEGAIHVDQTWNIPIPGNFGGTVYSSYGLYWTRDSLTTAIQQRARSQRYYNCSDGAFIDGTVAKKARGIQLPAITGGKADHIRQLFEAAPIYSRDEFVHNWTDEKFREYANAFLDELRDFIQGINSFSDRRYLAEMRRFLDTRKERWQTGMAVLFRGTFFMSFLAIEYYLARVKDPDHIKVFEDIAREKLLAMVEDLRQKAMQRLGSLSKVQSESSAVIDRGT